MVTDTLLPKLIRLCSPHGEATGVGVEWTGAGLASLLGWPPANPGWEYASRLHLSTRRAASLFQDDREKDEAVRRFHARDSEKGT